MIGVEAENVGEHEQRRDEKWQEQNRDLGSRDVRGDARGRDKGQDEREREEREREARVRKRDCCEIRGEHCAWGQVAGGNAVRYVLRES